MEPPSTVSVGIVNSTRSRVTHSLLRKVVVLATSPVKVARSIEVLLTDDEEMARLNRTHRNIDSSTDVLSFPGPDFPGAPLGEIVISVPWAKRQAKAHRLKLSDEICYLAIHGALHLIGLDDQTDEDRAKMVSAMSRIGRLAGLPEFDDWSSEGHSGGEAIGQ